MMLMDSPEDSRIERKELKVLCRSLSRRKQIHTGISHY